MVPGAGVSIGVYRQLIAALTEGVLQGPCHEVVKVKGSDQWRSRRREERRRRTWGEGVKVTSQGNSEATFKLEDIHVE